MIVGLAAYGDPAVLKDVLLARFDEQPGSFRIPESNNVHFTRLLATQFPKIDVAAAYQHVLERGVQHVQHYLRRGNPPSCLVRRRGEGGTSSSISVAEGVAEVDAIFIHPNMGDGGCGTGAALLAFAGRPELREPLKNVFLGPSYSDPQLTEALTRSRLGVRSLQRY